jgi:hypothetical protein
MLQRCREFLERGIARMSSQPPYDPSRRQVNPASYGSPGVPVPPVSPSEYIPIGATQQTYAPPYTPMQPPAYLYPLPYTPVAPSVPVRSKWPMQGLALSGLILGLTSVLLWFMPCLGDVVPLFGIALSILGWRAPTRNWMAILGCALSAAALVLAVYNSALGGALFPH